MPSNYDTAFQETMSRLKTGLDATYPNLNVEWPNVRNEKPEHRAGQTDATAPWARVVWQHVNSQQQTVGSVNGKRRYENKGLLTVSFFTPSGYGTQQIAEFIIWITTLFNAHRTPSGVIFEAGTPQDLGQDGPFFRSDAQFDFKYDEIK